MPEAGRGYTLLASMTQLHEQRRHVLSALMSGAGDKLLWVISGRAAHSSILIQICTLTMSEKNQIFHHE